MVRFGGTDVHQDFRVRVNDREITVETGDDTKRLDSDASETESLPDEEPALQDQSSIAPRDLALARQIRRALTFLRRLWKVWTVAIGLLGALILWLMRFDWLRALCSSHTDQPPP